MRKDEFDLKGTIVLSEEESLQIYGGQSFWYYVGYLLGNHGRMVAYSTENGGNAAAVLAYK